MTADNIYAEAPIEVLQDIDRLLRRHLERLDISRASIELIRDLVRESRDVRAELYRRQERQKQIQYAAQVPSNN